MDGAWDITVKTIGNEASLRYLNWVENNRRKVEEATGGRIGHMRVPDTSISGVIMFDKYFTGQQGKDGLIVDERFNHGGWSPDFYTEKLGRPLLLAPAGREGKDFVPQAAFFGPKVMIVNEQRPALVLQGHDPQLEKAIELAKEGLKTMPAPLHHPPYPIKAPRPVKEQSSLPKQ